MAPAPLSVLLLILSLGFASPNLSLGFLELGFEEGEADPLSILSWHDYSPPTPPPPPPLDPPAAVSCESDLGGAGSFDTVCELSSSVLLSDDIYIKGNGSISILAGVSLACRTPGCTILANLSGELRLGNGSWLVAGTVYVAATNVTVASGAAVSAEGLAGDPPPQTSGSPTGNNGDGGGHGGRGASCVVREGQTPDDSWGGDGYSWASLMKPDSYGSKGGTTSSPVSLQVPTPPLAITTTSISL